MPTMDAMSLCDLIHRPTGPPNHLRTTEPPNHLQGPTVRAMSLSDLRDAVAMTMPRASTGRSLPRSSSVDEIGARQMMKHRLEVQTSYETRLAQKVLPSLTPTLPLPPLPSPPPPNMNPDPTHHPNPNPNLSPNPHPHPHP
jgi:hypothetical protein